MMKEIFNNEEENILKNIFSNYNKLLKIKYGSVEYDK
jgi:hypothetical protein